MARNGMLAAFLAEGGAGGSPRMLEDDHGLYATFFGAVPPASTMRSRGPVSSTTSSAQTPSATRARDSTSTPSSSRAS